MPQTETWTIGRLLEWTCDYLKSRGADCARLDAELLLAEARGCQRIELYTAFDDVPDDAARTAFRELVRRRAEGVPVAYLLGRREFYSLMFHVTPDVLIPRPETEHVVVALLDHAKGRMAESSRPLCIADVGTGSVILAVCAARYLKGAHVVALDISRRALAVARDNIHRHGLSDRIDTVAGDVMEHIAPRPSFDFIVSNPPYISSDEIQQLPTDVAGHEPRVALEAGPRGTEVIERLAAQSAERLIPGGHLIFEISPMIEEAARAVIDREPRFELEPTHKDLAGLARVVSARRKA